MSGSPTHLLLDIYLSWGTWLHQDFFLNKMFNIGANQRGVAGEEEAKLNIGREDEEECFLGSLAFLHRQSRLFRLQPFLLDQREDLLDFKRKLKANYWPRRNMYFLHKWQPIQLTISLVSVVCLGLCVQPFLLGQSSLERI